MLPLRDYPFAARPMIVAHRGDTSLGARENSIEAAQAALISGADMIELDIQWSADEEFVCYHDALFEPLGAEVHTLTYKELKGAGITSLTEILEATKGKTYFNLEVKEYSARDPREFMQQLIELLTKLGAQEYTLISSFRMDYLREAGWTIPTVVIHPDDEMYRFFAMRSYANPIVLQRPLTTYLPSELLAVSRATSYACRLSELTPDCLADIEKYNIMLSVYTISSELDFDRAVACGARALVCERPQEFAALRNRRFPSIETMPRE
jgi:glycerophosphoryl diester phosphodiesterase